MKRHLLTHNANGEPIYYLTLEEHELKEWAETQTPEQKRLADWVERLQRGENPVFVKMWDGILR